MIHNNYSNLEQKLQSNLKDILILYRSFHKIQFMKNKEDAMH